MSLKIFVIFILLSLVHYYHGIQLDSILTHPDEVVYRDEGSNVSFEWNFQIGSWPNPRPKVVEFLFGEWAHPEYMKKKILSVHGHNQVKKRPGFEKKLDWRGNIYECVCCTAVVVMYNLTRADFNLSYGVNIELGVDRSPLTNWLRLVKTEPASITKWTQNIEVHEGNSTIIECRASGLPPPSVKIKRNKQTLQTCNDTKPCVYKIQAARPEDQGEYVCLVQQGTSSVVISRSLNLTVLRTRKTLTKTTVEAKQPYLDRFLNYPDEVVYRDEGSNVTFEWNFQIGSWPNPRPRVVEFLFGEWAHPEYMKKKILSVYGHNQVNKRPGFEKKVDWRGNIYECVTCTTVVVMYNLTRADFKSYGVRIELGVDRSPLTNWLRLVKTEPASITKWTLNIEVHEGNSTIIECRASGLPPPSVKIQRQNQTLQTCIDTKPCVYKIQAARSEDQGEYVCLVQQGNSSVVISRSLNLTVLRTGKTLTKGIVDEPISPNTPSASSPSTAHSHSVNTMQWGWSAYLAIPAVVLLIMEEGSFLRSHVFVIILAGIAVQTSGSSLTGYINEELDIPCTFQRQKDNVVVKRYLCNPNELGKFVLSTWNKTIQNYTKVCILGHERFEICDSWTTSYVHGKQTHFVIRNTPWELNWCKTQCVYEDSSEFGAHHDKVQVIRLKARGKVNGTIKLKLSIPKRHIRITFEINKIPVLRVEISNGLSRLHCVKDRRNVCQIVSESSNHHCVPGYDVCLEHMTSSYVNSSFFVFIFKNTPAYLNNSKLQYLIDFVDHEKLWNDAIQGHETVLLLYKDTTTTATTTSPPPTENTTTTATTTFPPPTESPKKNGLSTGAKIGIICAAILVFFIVSIVIISKRHEQDSSSGRTYASL